MKDFVKKQYYLHQETISNLFWRGLQVFGKQGITFLIFVLSAKLLTPYDFGLYNYVFAVILLLIMFSDFGISTAASRYVAEYQLTDKNKLRTILFNAGLIIFVLSFVLIVLILLFGQEYLKEKYFLILYFLPLIFLIPVTSLYDGIYRGLKLFKISALISIIIGLFSLFFVYFFIKTYGLIGALISQDVFYLVLFLGLSLGYRDFNFKFDWFLLKKLWQYGLVIGIGGLGLIFYSRIDTLFLGHFNYISEISYYEIVNKVLALVILPFLIVAQVIAPNITRQYVGLDYLGVYNKYKKYLLLSFIFGAIITLLLYLLKDFLLITFLTEYATAEMKVIFNWLLIVFFTQMLNGVVPLGFVISTGHAKISAYFLIFFGLAHIVLNLILINLFGYLGIIYSIVITKVVADVSFLLYYGYILKCLTK